MKKKYIKPEIVVIEMEYEGMLCSSPVIDPNKEIGSGGDRGDIWSNTSKPSPVPSRRMWDNYNNN